MNKEHLNLFDCEFPDESTTIEWNGDFAKSDDTLINTWNGFNSFTLGNRSETPVPPQPSPSEKYGEIIAKLSGKHNSYLPVIYEGVVTTDYNGDKRNTATEVIDDISCLVSTTNKNTGGWEQECVIIHNPYQLNNNLSKYIILCIKLKTGTTASNDDGILMIPNGFPDNMINNSNFKRFNSYVELNDKDWSWIKIDTGTSSNQWIRTGISSPNMNICIPYMIYTSENIEI